MSKFKDILSKFSFFNKKTVAYLIIEDRYPTVHKNHIEALNFVNFVRNTDKESKKLKAMVSIVTQDDFKEGFCNCTFKPI